MFNIFLSMAHDRQEGLHSLSASSSPTERQEGAANYERMWEQDAHLDANSSAAFHRCRLILELARKFAPKAHKILDVGCSQGTLLQHLKRAYKEVVLSGVDISSQALGIARSRNPYIKFFRFDRTVPGFLKQQHEHSGLFDLITYSEVLEPIADDSAAVRRLYDLTLANGYLIVMVPGGARSRFDAHIGHLHHYTSASLRGLLLEAGILKLLFYLNSRHFRQQLVALASKTDGWPNANCQQ